MSYSIKRRGTAVAWFVIVGLLPATAAYVTFTQYSPISFLLFLLLPILLAAVFGGIIGTTILQPDRVQSQRRALFTGLKVSVASYLALAVCFLVLAMAHQLKPFHLLRVLMMLAVYVFGLLFIVPAVYFGLFALSVAVGVIAGWLMYVFRDRTRSLLFFGGVLIPLVALLVLWRLPNPNKIPVYPGATNIQTGDFELSDSSDTEQKTTTFDAVDSPQSVLNYYENQLTREGWWRVSRSEVQLVVRDPSGKYRIFVEPADPGLQNGQMRVTLWHDVSLSFP